MRFGISLPNLGELGDPATLIDLARDAESGGWDGFFLWDHIVWREPVPIVDCWVTLGAIAAVTHRLRIGPLVTPLPRRRPWKVAREAATLDVLSGGRVILGVGLGAPAEEFECFAEPWDDRIRAEKLDEGLEILEQAWQGAVEYRGRHFTVTNAQFEPKPVHGRIPVWVGGYWPNRPPMRRAARWDGVVARRRGSGATEPPRSLTPEEFDECSRFVGDLRGSVGADGPYDYVAWGETSHLEITEARDHVRRYAARGATWWMESTASALATLSDVQDTIRRGPPRTISDTSPVNPEFDPVV